MIGPRYIVLDGADARDWARAAVGVAARESVVCILPPAVVATVVASVLVLLIAVGVAIEQRDEPRRPWDGARAACLALRTCRGPVRIVRGAPVLLAHLKGRTPEC